MFMVRTEGQTICSRARYLLRNTRSLVLPIFGENTTVIVGDNVVFDYVIRSMIRAKLF